MDKTSHGCIMLGDGINDASALAGKLKERKAKDIKRRIERLLYYINPTST